MSVKPVGLSEFADPAVLSFGLVIENFWGEEVQGVRRFLAEPEGPRLHTPHIPLTPQG